MTVSTSKVPLIPTLLGEGTVDQVINYTTHSVAAEIPAGSVDFFFDTMQQSAMYIVLVKRGWGCDVDLDASGAVGGKEGVSGDVVGCWDRVGGGGCVVSVEGEEAGVRYGYFFPDRAEFEKNLERLGGWVLEGKVRTVVGWTERLGNFEGVVEGCGVVHSGKGGVGKFVIEVVLSGQDVSWAEDELSCLKVIIVSAFF